MRHHPSLRDESGQAITEYILLLSVLVSIFVGVAAALRGKNLGAMVTKPIQQDFKYAYQYGHPKARGYDDGGPTKHPRAVDPTGSDTSNFRIFLNPEAQ